MVVGLGHGRIDCSSILTSDDQHAGGVHGNCTGGTSTIGILVTSSGGGVVRGDVIENTSGALILGDTVNVIGQSVGGVTNFIGVELGLESGLKLTLGKTGGQSQQGSVVKEDQT